MATTTFDTMAYAKRFKAAGFTEQQAEEVVTALREVRDTRMEELATKADLAETKAEIIKWMFGVAAGQAVFIVTILKMFQTH
ncbi:MAG: DUF1640 domain-containing protein [Magnetococcales bacterium]|uniref:DUF1640 domain-containing protein n=1 Tax=Candidatus Magnetaquicoccus inordinatus TaxID=2496818 RepID=UPI00102BBB72|nr:DUF1640 domain-containing protein [Candidatus Magnetaquicoccus inordinatus]MBF0098392.1 DUF1640 domain-containing protein [Magnetococcales bacterium]MBF0116004.1 DUF1640 domain-containing protein [Magnetococcales bacterium]